MDITPNIMTIDRLLSSRCNFIITRYQREYSWENEHYKEFIDDMLSGLKYTDEVIGDSSYFLGTMLFVGDYLTPGQKLEVVDGQQRLTTITILFSAISDHFIEIGEDNLSKLLFRYVMTEDNDGKEVKVLESKTHFPFFAYYIQDRIKNKNRKPASEEEQNILEAYEYLFKRTGEDDLRRTMCKLHESNKTEIRKTSYLDLLKALRDQVLNSLVVIISTKEKEEANKIFEILNAKGKKLANVDLIKNQIFSICKKEQPYDDAELIWGNIKAKLNSRDEAIGMGTFLYHYWLSRYSSSSEKKLYDNFMKKITPASEENYLDFLRNMEKNAEYYIEIIRPERRDFGNRKEYYWLVQSLNCLSNWFNISKVRIALMAALEKKEQGIVNSKMLKRLVKYLESFHFAYNTMLAKSANRLTHHADFARKLRNCSTPEECDECITDLITKLDLLFPTEEEFTEAFTRLTYTKKTESIDNMKTKYVVNKLECFYSSDHHDVFDDNGSIEHILPESTGEAALGIGNLILLECTLNQNSDNDDYAVKKENYKKSKYDWVKEFVNENDSWTQEKITARAEKMAQVYYHNVLGRP